eukprot:scaffold2220_cov377-Prasinococcus_capsulatus_cf.AAC.1
MGGWSTDRPHNPKLRLSSAPAAPLAPPFSGLGGPQVAQAARERGHAKGGGGGEGERRADRVLGPRGAVAQLLLLLLAQPPPVRVPQQEKAGQGKAARRNATQRNAALVGAGDGKIHARSRRSPAAVTASSAAGGGPQRRQARGARRQARVAAAESSSLRPSSTCHGGLLRALCPRGGGGGKLSRCSARVSAAENSARLRVHINKQHRRSV